MVPEGLV